MRTILALVLCVASAASCRADVLRTVSGATKYAYGSGYVECFSPCPRSTPSYSVISGACSNKIDPPGKGTELVAFGPHSGLRPQAWYCSWRNADPSVPITGICRSFCAKIEH